MEGFTTGSIVASIVAGILLVPVTIWLTHLIERYKPVWRGFDLAALLPKALPMAASVVLIYVALLVLIGMRKAPEPAIAIVPPEPPTSELVRSLGTEIGRPMTVADPRFYPELEFEFEVEMPAANIFALQRKRDPDAIVRLEARLELHENCWGTWEVGSTLREVQIHTMRQAAFAAGFALEMENKLGKQWMVLERTIRVSSELDGSDLYLELENTYGARRMAAGMEDAFCRAGGYRQGEK